MADLLIERTQNTSWVVAYKALITIHHLMCYGNEVFFNFHFVLFFSNSKTNKTRDLVNTWLRITANLF